MASDSYNVAAVAPTAVQNPQPAGIQVQRSVTQGQSSAEVGVAPALQSGQKVANQSGGDQSPAATVEEVGKAVEKLNEMMELGRQQLTFQLDDDSGRMVIRVMDAQTSEVIRQIPNEETLRFAEYVDGLVGMIFSKNA